MLYEEPVLFTRRHLNFQFTRLHLKTSYSRILLLPTDLSMIKIEDHTLFGAKNQYKILFFDREFVLRGLLILLMFSMWYRFSATRLLLSEIK